MSSQMGVISSPEKAPYSAAKAGLIGMTKVCSKLCNNVISSTLSV